MTSRRLNEINAGSMADIAFLLLIFFLVATIIDADMGILRKLPPLDDDPPPIDRRERNVMEVLVNRNNQLMVENKLADLRSLRVEAKKFITNSNNDDQFPVLELQNFKYFGTIPVTKKHIISLRSDRGTSYGMYIAVQNELVGAYTELRNELAKDKWGILYDELTEEKKKVIDSIYPMKISEAEPR